MNKQFHKNERQKSSEFFISSDSAYNSRLSNFIAKAHSLQTFYFAAGLSQVLLGVGVITVAVLGLLTPMWLSVLFVMLASVTTIIGLFLLYITATKTKSKNSLLRTAMKRVMEYRN
jgi:hypothetical protein